MTIIIKIKGTITIYIFIMEIMLWMTLGVLAGWLSSFVMSTHSSRGFASDIMLGIIGAIIGGYMMNLFGASGMNGFNLYSIVVAAMSSILLVWLGRTVRSHA